MLERVSTEVMAERERMAARVRDELAAAGLPIRPESMDPQLGQPGAEVSVEYWDADGVPVTVDWRVSASLHAAFMQIAPHELLDRRASRHYKDVLEAMLQAMTTILTSAGFTVRESTNDYTPFRLDVLDMPQAKPVWRPSTDE